MHFTVFESLNTLHFQTTLHTNHLNDMENLKQLREENENLINQQSKSEWKTKYSNLNDEFQILKSSEALLRQTILGKNSNIVQVAVGCQKWCLGKLEIA